MRSSNFYLNWAILLGTRLGNNIVSSYHPMSNQQKIFAHFENECQHGHQMTVTLISQLPANKNKQFRTSKSKENIHCD